VNRSATLLLLLVASCARPLPQLRIDGSPGVAPLVAALIAPYMKSHPSAPVTIGTELGSSARIAALAEGRIDIAMASHGVDTAALRARGIVAHEIARTAVVFAVGGDVMRTSVTSVVVCDIYSGRLGNWADQLGIVPLMRPAAEVDAEVAIAAIPCLKGLTMAPSVMVIERPDDMAAEIASRRGAFGLTSLPYVERSNHRLRALAFDGVAPTPENVANGRYTMIRRAYLLTRAEPEANVRMFLEFVRGAEGARVLRANGAVPSR
jgi:phosphate transport system substrate-binding protein